MDNAILVGYRIKFNDKDYGPYKNYKQALGIARKISNDGVRDVQLIKESVIKWF